MIYRCEVCYGKGIREGLFPEGRRYRQCENCLGYGRLDSEKPHELEKIQRQPVTEEEELSFIPLPVPKRNPYWLMKLILGTVAVTLAIGLLLGLLYWYWLAPIYIASLLACELGKKPKRRRR